jgi:transcription elongation factor GreA
MYTLSKAAMEELQTKLTKLQLEKGEISKRIGLAREQGDLSENAEYHAAREALSYKLKQIADTIAHIENSRVSDDFPEFDGTIRVGTTVTLEINGDEETLDVVYKGSGDNHLSVESPIGKALLGKKVGFESTLNINNRQLPVKILAIKSSL